jgi:DNA-binding beta-propeller fold protein YncE
MTTFRLLAVNISIAAAALVMGAGRPTAQMHNSAPLQLEAKIPLGEVRGRIDHLAIDLARQWVFVAELGNDTVGIVDLKKREVIQRISGFPEPQGIGYVPATDSLYVANTGDGSVRVFAGADYAPAGRIDLGENADNIRVDSAAGQIVVGYGSGGLAAIDARTLQRIADIPLPVHPEGFQLDPASSQVFVNLPKAHAIAAVDRRTGKLTASWPVAIAGDNFPMALRRDAGEILTVFRNPAKLAAFSMKDGALLASADVCGDADDLFFDSKRQRVLVSCGEGFLDVLDAKESAYRHVTRIATVPGARTSLFVPELDRLLLAVRAEAEQPASIWVFRPTP